MNSISRTWPSDAAGRVPYWVYSDPDIYAAELERIWYGPHWLFCALEAEIPGSRRLQDHHPRRTPGHRGPQRRGRGQRGGEPLRPSRREVLPGAQGPRRRTCSALITSGTTACAATCKARRSGAACAGRAACRPTSIPKDHGLRKLRVEVVNGLVWATFSDDTPPFRDYLGERFWQHYTRVYDGRKLEVLGYNRQHIPGNWKLMQENIKDPYHASLLHVFFVTFGLFRADQKSATEIDPTGRHGILISRAGQQEINDVTSGMRTFRSDISLADPRIMDVVQEFPGEDTVGMITRVPQRGAAAEPATRSASAISCRPGPDGFDFHWTHWGYADDTPEMRLRRTRQANLFGPAGFVSADDGEIIEMCQQGFAHYPDEDALVVMGGREIESVEHMVTEVGIRGMYRYWREAMGL